MFENLLSYYGNNAQVRINERIEKINNQICFCTEISLKLLSFKESYTVHSMN